MWVRGGCLTFSSTPHCTWVSFVNNAGGINPKFRSCPHRFPKNLYFFFFIFFFHDYIARFACNDRDTRIRKNSHEMAKLVSALAIIALLLSLQGMSEGGGPNPIYPKPKRRQQMKGEIEWGNWRSMSDRFVILFVAGERSAISSPTQPPKTGLSYIRPCLHAKPFITIPQTG